MTFIGSAVRGVLKAVGLVSDPAQAAPPAPIASVTRDDAVAAANSRDELLRRKGGAADVLTGTRGAEAPSATGKTTLGS